MKRKILATLVLFTALLPWNRAVAQEAQLEDGNVTTQEMTEAQALEEAEAQEKLDIKGIIFDHLGDGYGWEVPFNHHKRIPLPVIVYGSDGWHVFSSSHVTHGEPYTDGNATFLIPKYGEYKGKVVEVVNGEYKRPFYL